MSRIDTRMMHSIQPQAPPPEAAALRSRPTDTLSVEVGRGADRVDLSPGVRPAEQVAGANREAAASAPATVRSMMETEARLRTADTFGADKAVDAFPNMGVAPEGKIDRPLLKPVEGAVAKAAPPEREASNGARAASPQAPKTTSPRATLEGSRPHGASTEVRSKVEPAPTPVRPTDVGQATPGERQDAQPTRQGGSPVDFTAGPGGAINLQA